MLTSFRMYNVTARTAAAWRALFERVFADTGVAIDIIEHRGPTPIAELWAKPNLCCAFMCGWPFVRSERAMQPIAAPVPAPPRYEGLPRYCSEFLVREASGWATLEETFGHRFGWMSADSQSGFNAPRAHLAGFVTPKRPRLFSEVKGPLGTPASSLDALRADIVDVIALDSFYLDLLRHHEPARLDGIRCVATTAWTPIPLLVAAPGIDAQIVRRLRDRLIDVHEDASYAALLGEVLLARFVEPEASAYRELEAMAERAAGRGYEEVR